MNLLIRTLVIMVILMGVLSSCFAPKNLNKENKPFTDDILSKIKPGKRYKFELKTGPSQTVTLPVLTIKLLPGFTTRNKGKGRKGLKVIFQPVLKNIQEGVAKIYVRKFNPILTTVAKSYEL